MTNRLTLAAALLAAPAAGAGKPNIVLVMADDQGLGDMAYTGHKILKTPHFDKLAAEGLRFDRFYAAAPVCSPTRASVMTGRHPNRSAVFKWGHAIRPQEVTVAEALKKAGYRTGHFGKWHLGSVRKGSPVNPGNSGFDVWLSGENFFDNDPILSRGGVAEQLKGESSLLTAGEALKFIRESAAGGRPFLAVVWFGSPHNPHRAAEKYRAMYGGQPEAKANFYGEITAMDEAFGRIRAGIAAAGVKGDTILWYCSDNGGLPKVGDVAGLRGRKGSVYEGGLRVPALLEWPARVKSPRRVGVRCNTSDIYPTLLAAAGVTVENQPPLDGVDLSPVIEGKTDKRPRPMGFWDFPVRGIRTPNQQWMGELLKAQKAGREPTDRERLRLDAGSSAKKYPDTRLPGHAAWIDGDWKLHRIARPNKRVTEFKLYNLAADRNESSDMIKNHPERAAAMKGALAEWQKSVVASLNGEDYK